ncbi:double zinc ribbon domain-containing protein [Natrarchaeobius oligotrophus]|uniref:CopG family transcriptional regulator n=1 Tax=Natrarchaeobius chitinivorans TaxID=1679083 RepID=A0A3N6MCA0_NATCH|nr:zinc ribbon domain-containing protein [Natrarchaeobius chitinivorans]RQH01449.1 CopG family transcriptional regulator [Natrarchaeobius chitinivorans]
MSKITFRADDELIDELESLEVSKSEALREALRSYLDEPTGGTGSERDASETAIDDVVRERVDELLTDRLASREFGRRASPPATEPQDVNVTISLEGIEGEPVDRSDASSRARETGSSPVESRDRGRSQTTCGQCGERVDDDHVYCPNCGEKASHRLFCECGDELRSDWSFCPSCGRRTPAADVLESS